MEPNPYLVRTITVDGELVFEDTDFNPNYNWEWYEEVVRQADDGEIVQLISVADGLVIGETIVGS